MLSTGSSTTSFHDDMISVLNRLPSEEEFRRVQHLLLEEDTDILDDEVAAILPFLPHLESINLSGVPDTTDRTLVSLAKVASNLTSLNLKGLRNITDIGILEITSKGLPLSKLCLDGVTGLTDPAIASIARACPLLIQLDLCDLPLLTCIPIRDIWSFSRKLRILRLAHCPLLNDKGFPVYSPNHARTRLTLNEGEKPLPPRPTTWLEHLPPLILPLSADNLRVLDISSCPITDATISGICAHAPQLQTLVLSGCSYLTDVALEHLCSLGPHLDVLMMDRCPNLTDAGVIKVARACPNLRAVDFSFCRHLTDMSIHELAGLRGLRRLSLVRVHRLTDIALFALSQYCLNLERLHLSYCDRLSLDAIHVVLKRLVHLDHLSATGIPSLRRKGVERFSDHPPEDFDEHQKAAHHLFNGGNVIGLRNFLNKEEKRRRQCEAQNIPFVERSGDGMELF